MQVPQAATVYFFVLIGGERVSPVRDHTLGDGKQVVRFRVRGMRRMRMRTRRMRMRRRRRDEKDEDEEEEGRGG